MCEVRAMDNWKELYRSRLCTAQEAAARIPDGAYVVCAHVASEPRAILRALVERAGQMRGVTLSNMLCLGEMPYCAPGLEGHLHYETWFACGGSRAALREGRADFIPSYYSRIPELLEQRPPDVAILSLSAPNESGLCSLGLTADFQWAAASRAKLVIAQINDQMPFVCGECLVSVSALDAIVEVSEPIPQLPRPKLGEVERAIGRHCAGLIRDGDTLQLGIGAIPDALLGELTNKKDLGIHSEMISDGVMELMEAGVINNSRKKLHPGVSVATFLMGTDRFYRFLDHNSSVELYPVDHTNNPLVAAQNDNLVAINSALQVDLFGQVAAEAMGPVQFSGVGGQVDFFRSAALSRGGRAILALPSTAAKGTQSRIVAALPQGSIVTSTRNDVDYVVTEYGVAPLRGRSVRQRAENLIAIAHPDFRDLLRTQWEALLSSMP